MIKVASAVSVQLLSQDPLQENATINLQRNPRQQYQPSMGTAPVQAGPSKNIQNYIGSKFNMTSSVDLAGRPVCSYSLLIIRIGAGGSQNAPLASMIH